MKKFDKDFENISAMADGELREDQEAIYREKMQNSPAFKEKFNEYNKLKKTVESIPKLPEDHYFVSRLNEYIKKENKKTSGLRPFYKPAFGLVALTVVLMSFFKLSPEFMDDLFETQKGNIIDFYTKNLRPYFQEDELTKDDIFNFAFSQVLPIDGSGQNVISLDESGSGASIAIRQSSFGDSIMSLKEFTEKLDLDKTQQLKLNNVLKKYEDKIRGSILVNDNNTVAVNANLWNYNMALKAEILAIAAENETFAKVMPAGLMESMPAFASIDFADNEDSFVCINPDTVFVTSIRVNTHDPSYNIPVVNKVNILKNTQVKLAPAKQKYGGFHGKLGDSSKTKKFKVFVDTNFIKFDIPDFAFEHKMPTMIELERIDSLVELSMKNFNFEMRNFPDGRGFSFDMKFDSLGLPGHDKMIEFKFDTTDGFNFDMNFPGKDSGKFKIVVPKNPDVYKNFKGLEGLDSLMIFKFNGKDTVFNFNMPFQNFDGEFKEFNEEMKKFREEMKKFREDFKPTKPKNKKDKKPVVI